MISQIPITPDMVKEFAKNKEGGIFQDLEEMKN